MSFSAKRVLVIDAIAQQAIQGLEDIGFRVDYRPDIEPLQVAKALEGAVGLIFRNKIPIDAALLETQGLRFVARAGAGLDKIDLRTAKRVGVHVIHAAEGNADAVAEHTLGMLLSLLNHLPAATESVRRGEWLRERYRGKELKGKCVGILGYGCMGKAFGRLLQGLGCQVLAHDINPLLEPLEGVEKVSFEELQLKAQILSIHIDYTLANHHFINAKRLNGFRHSIVLINTARGGVLCHAALCKALKEGQVCAAALDVLENENIHALNKEESQRFAFLGKHPAVLLSPHVAGWSHESYARIAEVLLEKIKGFVAGDGM